MPKIVHLFGFGHAACGIEGLPKVWPEDHTWTPDWEDVTCKDCLKGQVMIETFTVAEDGKSITCKRCKKISYNYKDIEHHYCGYCHVFHDDLWPPARIWWINSMPAQIPGIG